MALANITSTGAAKRRLTLSRTGRASLVPSSCSFQAIARRDSCCSSFSNRRSSAASRPVIGPPTRSAGVRIKSSATWRANWQPDVCLCSGAGVRCRPRLPLKSAGPSCLERRRRLTRRPRLILRLFRPSTTPDRKPKRWPMRRRMVRPSVRSVNGHGSN